MRGRCTAACARRYVASHTGMHPHGRARTRGWLKTPRGIGVPHRCPSTAGVTWWPEGRFRLVPLHDAFRFCSGSGRDARESRHQRS